MPLFEFEGVRPTVHSTAFVAPTASVIGDVTIEANASVWYGAVLRGDIAPIVVRARANVQEGAVLHGSPGQTTEVGPGVTVAHLSIVHGAFLEKECMIGNGATVLDGARIGARSLIGAGSVVPSGMVVPAGSLAVGSPAQVKRQLVGPAAELVATNAQAYVEMAKRHFDGLALVASEPPGR